MAKQAFVVCIDSASLALYQTVWAHSHARVLVITQMKLNKFTLIGGLTGVFLVFFGWFVENQQLDFFWESRDIGIALLVLTFGVHLTIWKAYIIPRISEESKPIWTGIFQVFLGTTFVIQIIIVNVSTPVETAKQSIRNNRNVINEIGEIEGFGLIVNGVPTIISSRSANFNIVVKGSKEIQRYDIELLKENDQWIINSIQKFR